MAWTWFKAGRFTQPAVLVLLVSLISISTHASIVYRQKRAQGDPKQPYQTYDDLHQFNSYQYKTRWTHAGYRPIKWRVRNMPKRADFTKRELENEVERAFNLWGDCAKIEFQKTHKWPEIDISFQRDNHPPCEKHFYYNEAQMSDPFGNPKHYQPVTVIAHAYPPPDDNWAVDRMMGDIHVNRDWNFVLRKPKEYPEDSPLPEHEKEADLFFILLHEIGHTLGLIEHDTYNNYTIMAPEVDNTWDRNMKVLPGADLYRMRILYGAQACAADSRSEELGSSAGVRAWAGGRWSVLTSVFVFIVHFVAFV